MAAENRKSVLVWLNRARESKTKDVKICHCTCHSSSMQKKTGNLHKNGLITKYYMRYEG
jgi:hypothetical protein